jgi:hypothetical protein
VCWEVTGTGAGAGCTEITVRGRRLIPVKVTRESTAQYMTVTPTASH